MSTVNASLRPTLGPQPATWLASLDTFSGGADAHVCEACGLAWYGFSTSASPTHRCLKTAMCDSALHQGFDIVIFASLNRADGTPSINPSSAGRHRGFAAFPCASSGGAK